MATTRVKKTKEQLLQETKDKVKQLEAELKAAARKKAPKLVKTSAGMPEAITAVTKAAALNKTTVADILVALASIKRTGLVIEHTKRHTKADDAYLL